MSESSQVPASSWYPWVGLTRSGRQRLAATQAQVARLVEDAQVERDAVLADLLSRREALEAKVAELEVSQREYRQRLRTLISEQLAAVDTDEWDREIRALQG